jgi:voltage-gated potassium channel
MKRRQVYAVLSGAVPGVSRQINVLLITAIVVSMLCVVLESMHEVVASYGMLIHTANNIAVGIFVIEYLLRVWTCVENPKYRHNIKGRLRFIISPMMVIDALAIMPALLLGIGLDLRSLRLFRALRLFRVLKMARYVTALDAIRNVLHQKRHQLAVTVGIVFFLLLVTSSLMYELEHEAQPNAFSSIPATMWWAVASLTTVGYGDIFPITPLGKFLAAVTAVLGVGLVALPAGILASGFSTEVSSRDPVRKCHECGAELEQN